MPLDVDVFPFQPSTPEPTPVVPVGSISPWIETIGPGGLTELDPLVNGVIVVPLSATTSSRLILHRSAGSGTIYGTTLRVRMIYAQDDSENMIDPVIRIFASDTNGTKWSAIRNLQGELSVPISRDLINDTYMYVLETGHTEDVRGTIPDNDAHSWDCDGYEYFYIGVERAYANMPAGSGSPQAAWLEARIV